MDIDGITLHLIVFLAIRSLAHTKTSVAVYNIEQIRSDIGSQLTSMTDIISKVFDFNEVSTPAVENEERLISITVSDSFLAVRILTV